MAPSQETLGTGFGIGIRTRLSLALLVCLAAPSAFAGDALIAVATNFSEVMERLESDFEKSGEYTLTVTTGSTGTLYAQIRNGAPFDVFLAADQRRPKLLEVESRAVSGSRFTYAVGRLTLWSPDEKRVAADGMETLWEGAFRRLAIANPELAPYGVAARETLMALELFDKLRERIVRGENIGQAHALVATGNADLGFVALSYVLSPRNEHTGSRWDVPQELYTPIRQDAVLLKSGAGNAAARAFLDFLRTDAAHAIIEEFGYGVD